MLPDSKYPFDVSIIIVSFNTRDLLRKCLQSIIQEAAQTKHEIIVIDNASKDHSAEMVAQEFPEVRLIRSDVNLGFGVANNAAIKMAQGQYILLLNSDAFLHERALEKALHNISTEPRVGIGGGRLVGPQGEWQPSARLFPSFLNEFLQMSGLAAKYPKSRFFGRYNRTWDFPEHSCLTDWITGAFAIIPRVVFEAVGGFDENFFLYYEEVDLCKRIKDKGYTVAYWGDVIVTHLGGESSKTVKTDAFSKKEAMLTLWRVRSELLYFRKHYGWLSTLLIASLEKCWHRVRALKNWKHPEKAEESRQIIHLMDQAWRETQGGKVSPPKPW